MTPAVAVLLKEVKDNLRDRRSLLTAMIYPLVGPLLFGIILHFTGDITAGDKGGPFAVAVAGAQHAPGLVAHLEKEGVVVRPAPADPEAAVRGGSLQVAMVIESGFEERMRDGGQGAVTLVSDPNRLVSEVLVQRLAGLIHAYSRSLAEERLKALGLPPEVLQPIAVQTVKASAPGNLADVFLRMVPPLILFNLFIGGVYLAIDATSGERERGSLEPLMTVPARRWEIVLGKYLATYGFTLFALIVQLAAFLAVFLTVGEGRFTPGKEFTLGIAVRLLAVALPLMATTVAVQIVIATMTRSFKEAQTWLGLLPLVPALPSMVMVLLPVREQLWMACIPVFSQTVALSSVVRGEELSWTFHLVAATGTLLLAWMLFRLAARLFDREEMVFGG